MFTSEFGQLQTHVVLAEAIVIVLLFSALFVLITHIISNEHNSACKLSAEATLFLTSFFQNRNSTHIFALARSLPFHSFHTLIHLLWITLAFLLLFLAVSEILSARNATATLPLLMLWFTQCYCVVGAVVPILKEQSENSSKRNTIMGAHRRSIRTVSHNEHLLFGLFFNCMQWCIMIH